MEGSFSKLVAETLATMGGSLGWGRGAAMKELFAFPTNLWVVGRDSGVQDLPEEAGWRTGIWRERGTALHTAAAVHSLL